MIKKNNNNNNKKKKISFQYLNRGRQRGKLEAQPLHHGDWQFSQSNTIFKYSVEQRGPTKLIMEDYFCRSYYFGSTTVGRIYDRNLLWNCEEHQSLRMLLHWIPAFPMKI